MALARGRSSWPPRIAPRRNGRVRDNRRLYFIRGRWKRAPCHRTVLRPRNAANDRLVGRPKYEIWREHR